MTHYVLTNEWQLDAPVDRVWDVLLRSADWPAWWHGIRSVEQIESGDDSGVGMRLRQQWRSLLPYTLKLDLEILHVEQRRLLVGRATGDMAGTCTFAFDETPRGTTVRFEMNVRPTKTWMNLPVPFADRVVRLNYDVIMRRGGEGLSGLLVRDASGSAAEGQLAGA